LDTYRVVLYIHLLSLFVGVGAGAVLVVCLTKLRAATTLAEAVPWGQVAGKTGRFFPLAIVGLVGSGAYLTTDLWTWSTGWIDVALAGVAVVALQGPLLGERTAKKLERALHGNGPGRLGEHARRLARHPYLWLAELSNFGIVFAIVWNMTEKPGTWSAIAAVVIGYAAGAAAALAISRLPSEQLAPATESAT
jgi:hypothetical protein